MATHTPYNLLHRSSLHSEQRTANKYLKENKIIEKPRAFMGAGLFVFKIF
jgi:hypothetical protein